MWLAFRERLPQAVVDEMDHYSAVLRGYLYNQHDDAGAHTDVTADSVTTPLVSTSKIIGTGPEAGDRLIVTDTAGTTLFQFGQERSPAVSALRRKMNVSPLDMQLLQRLTLGTRVDATLSSGAMLPSSGFENGLGPDRICYRITNAGTGLFFRIPNAPAAGSSPNFNDLQLIVVWNDTSTTLIVGSPTLAGAFSDGVHGGPLTLGPQGTLMLLYDNSLSNSSGTDGGWRIIGVNGLGWASYTPDLVSNGTAPSLGTGATQEGAYMANGEKCDFWARILLGSGFSLGTGVIGVTLPLDHAFPISNRFPGNVNLIDSATPYIGLSRFGSTGAVDALLLSAVDMGTGGASGIDATTPFTWAAGDGIYVSGEYPIG